MNNLSFTFFGTTNYSKELLLFLLEKDLVPKVIFSIPQGFSSPDNSWFKGESIEFVKSKLLDDNANIYKYMDKSSTQKLIYEHLIGDKNRRLFIWSLLNFEEWSDIYG
ncbi:asparagine synthase-related protein [Aliarcobacter cryaerophilus]|uniref:asparagine synthase-related protein n=1 Tax=Aliarcobacter cryaerophilus TaxID=28198 RepID=UPI003BAFC131